MNWSSVFFRKKGIIATIEHSDIAIEVASAEPTTSIFSTKRKKESSAMVATLEPMLMTMLVLTYPLMRR